MKNNYSDDFIIEILQSIKNGSTPNEMVTEYGVSLLSIRIWCNAAGVRIPRKKRNWESIKKAIAIK